MSRYLTIILACILILWPVSRPLKAMPVPSGPVVPEPPARAGGYYGYYYYDGDPLLLFLETALYVALAVTALIVLDEHLDNVTIVVQD